MKNKKKAIALRDALRRLIVANGTLVSNERPCGAPISTAAAYALLELSNRDEMTISELAETLAIDRTNVSRLCAKMEKNGELKYTQHPTDGRSKFVTLTKKGQRLATSIDETSSSHFADLVKHLGAMSNTVIDSLELLEEAMIQKGERDVE